MNTKNAIKRVGNPLAIFIITLMFGGAAMASDNNRSKPVVRGKLSIEAATMRFQSWNGAVFTPPRPSTVRPGRRVGQGRDPMAITTTGSQPDSTYTITRKGTPKPLGAKLKGNLSWNQVQELGKSAMSWKAEITHQPEVASIAATDVKIIKTREQIYWPGSEVMVKGTTRTADGKRKIETSYHVVQGRPTANETRDDMSGPQNQQRTFQLGGHFLKSAPVKFQQDNFLISTPKQNTEQIAMGKTEVKRSGRLLKAATSLSAWAARKQEKINAGDYNDKPELRQKFQNGVTKATAKANELTQRSTNLKAQGEQNIVAGEVLRSTVVSIGAVANAPSVSVVNQRVAGEGGAMHTFNGSVGVDNGVFKGEVAAFRGDKVVMTLSNPAMANQKVGSRMVVELRVPNPASGTKATRTIDGVKFYRPTVEHVEAFHDQALPLPQ